MISIISIDAIGVVLLVKPNPNLEYEMTFKWAEVLRLHEQIARAVARGINSKWI